MDNAPNKPSDVELESDDSETNVDMQLPQLDAVYEDLDKIEEARLKQLKNKDEHKREWLSLGHGELEELAEESEFFEITKKSKNVVCHFYKDDSPGCKIVDLHFRILAKDHLEATFCKINVVKCPFLTECLRIKVIPTIAAVIDRKTKDFIIGSANCGVFSTEVLESRIAQSGVIDYNDDWPTPKNKEKTVEVVYARRSPIRDSSDSEDSL